jgi:hypothetical protein
MACASDGDKSPAKSGDKSPHSTDELLPAEHPSLICAPRKARRPCAANPLARAVAGRICWRILDMKTIAFALFAFEPEVVNPLPMTRQSAI